MQVTKEYSGIKVTVNEEDLNKQGVIYLLEFPNGKVYIGQTTQTLKKRTKSHLKPTEGCVSLNRAIQKYKEFKVSVLEENLTIGQLNSFEAYYIKLFNSNAEDGYNLMSGGRNSKPSDETRKKLSEAISKDIRKKLSDMNKQKVKSIPGNMVFDSVGEAELFYKISIGGLSCYYNGKFHKPSGQTFIKYKEGGN